MRMLVLSSLLLGMTVPMSARAEEPVAMPSYGSWMSLCYKGNLDANFGGDASKASDEQIFTILIHCQCKHDNTPTDSKYLTLEMVFAAEKACVAEYRKDINAYTDKYRQRAKDGGLFKLSWD